MKGKEGGGGRGRGGGLDRLLLLATTGRCARW